MGGFFSESKFSKNIEKNQKWLKVRYFSECWECKKSFNIRHLEMILWPKSFIFIQTEKMLAGISSPLGDIAPQKRVNVPTGWKLISQRTGWRAVYYIMSRQVLRCYTPAASPTLGVAPPSHHQGKSVAPPASTPYTYLSPHRECKAGLQEAVREVKITKLI